MLCEARATSSSITSFQRFGIAEPMKNVLGSTNG